MILPIVKEPNAILHHKAVTVTQITKEIDQLITNMIQTMYVAEGVGLAANQVGSNLNIFVANPAGEKGKGREIVLINAVLQQRDGKEKSPEGCLSIPGVSGDVKRSATVVAIGLDRTGKKVAIEASGLLAKIVQHETDHLAGHLFPDRLGLIARRQILKKYKKLADTLRQVKL